LNASNFQNLAKYHLFGDAPPVPGIPMKIPPTGDLTLALPCGELVRAYTGIFLVGIGSVAAAMLWEN
jgi:hypothetical protein